MKPATEMVRNESSMIVFVATKYFMSTLVGTDVNCISTSLVVKQKEFEIEESELDPADFAVLRFSVALAPFCGLCVMEWSSFSQNSSSAKSVRARTQKYSR